MKKALLILAILGLGYLIHAQSVENIQVQSQDDKIRISYRIGSSTITQLYDVQLTCSMDGGNRFVPKTIEGDVGPGVAGGKSVYVIWWDVFKDLEEVGNVEFFIKVDLVDPGIVTQPQVQPQVQREEPEQVQQPKTETGAMYPDLEVGETTTKQEVPWSAYIAYSASLGSPVGISFGSLKNIGTYASFRYGSYIDDWEQDIWVSGIVGLNKFIVQVWKYRLHVYAGAGLTYENYQEYIYGTEWQDTFLTLDFGVNNVVGKLNVNIGVEVIRYTGTFPTIGLGVAF